MADNKAAEKASSPRRKSPASPTPEEEAAGILPPQHWVETAPSEGDDGDAESAIGTLDPSSTASISCSILKYRTLHGRRYHSEVGNAEYWGANDERQSESMDINHHTMTLACDGKLYQAPLEKGKVRKALDVGTGTGLWAIDFADEFPEAEVIGTDISPIQPGWVPPNLKFEIEDCTLPWTFAPNSFDYIHMRWLIGSIPDWSQLLAEAYKACRPGGWVESLEPECKFESDDDTVTDHTAVGQWGKIFAEGQKKTGRPFTVVREDLQRKGMEEAGFVDIQEFEFKLPAGTWPKDPKMKELGQLTQMVMEADTEGYVLFIANTLGWSRDEIQVYLAHFRREARQGKLHPYYRQKVIWGRKPE
ncbi:hypothetical protein SAPIO_CDS1250 [Scedosporium apiospermum]|uniref:Demethylmenaquinone methyltransferase n=1 Tax=Pseudallescheria apiosperma TaxID=563466 RepID=A0A084GEW9_PSEDA|nr:uncharacterized protein SAPIO_CDS1250 [Scedosporium apiospermum]KEZ45881.1 hypothetical protein SAPIO_CDS1250 [Scedosporium apiospermum]